MPPSGNRLAADALSKRGSVVSGLPGRMADIGSPNLQPADLGASLGYSVPGPPLRFSRALPALPIILSPAHGMGPSGQLSSLLQVAWEFGSETAWQRITRNGPVCALGGHIRWTVAGLAAGFTAARGSGGVANEPPSLSEPDRGGDKGILLGSLRIVPNYLWRVAFGSHKTILRSNLPIVLSTQTAATIAIPRRSR